MRKINVSSLSILAFAAAVNVTGGSIALFFRLPVYLDTVGTMLAAALLGPVYGMVPGLISGLVSGFTSDIYALYYIPVQLITGAMAGLLFKKFDMKGFCIILAAACISLPGTVVSAAITAAVFGGITSSGSTVLVQLLHVAGLNMTASVCAVQALTDYADRAVVLLLVIMILAALPSSMKFMIRKGNTGHGALQ